MPRSSSAGLPPAAAAVVASHGRADPAYLLAQHLARYGRGPPDFLMALQQAEPVQSQARASVSQTNTPRRLHSAHKSPERRRSPSGSPTRRPASGRPRTSGSSANKPGRPRTGRSRLSATQPSPLRPLHVDMTSTAPSAEWMSKFDADKPTATRTPRMRPTSGTGTRSQPDLNDRKVIAPPKIVTRLRQAQQAASSASLPTLTSSPSRRTLSARPAPNSGQHSMPPRPQTATAVSPASPTSVSSPSAASRYAGMDWFNDALSTPAPISSPGSSSRPRIPSALKSLSSPPKSPTKHVSLMPPSPVSMETEITDVYDDGTDDAASVASDGEAIPVLKTPPKLRSRPWGASSKSPERRSSLSGPISGRDHLLSGEVVVRRRSIAAVQQTGAPQRSSSPLVRAVPSSELVDQTEFQALAEPQLEQQSDELSEPQAQPDVQPEPQPAPPAPATDNYSEHEETDDDNDTVFPSLVSSDDGVEATFDVSPVQLPALEAVSEDEHESDQTGSWYMSDEEEDFTFTVVENKLPEESAEPTVAVAEASSVPEPPPPQLTQDMLMELCDVDVPSDDAAAVASVLCALLGWPIQEQVPWWKVRRILRSPITFRTLQHLTLRIVPVAVRVQLATVIEPVQSAFRIVSWLKALLCIKFEASHLAFSVLSPSCGFYVLNVEALAKARLLLARLQQAELAAFANATELPPDALCIMSSVCRLLQDGIVSEEQARAYFASTDLIERLLHLVPAAVPRRSRQAARAMLESGGQLDMMWRLGIKHPPLQVLLFWTMIMVGLEVAPELQHILPRDIANRPAPLDALVGVFDAEQMPLVKARLEVGCTTTAEVVEVACNVSPSAEVIGSCSALCAILGQPVVWPKIQVALMSPDMSGIMLSISPQDIVPLRFKEAAALVERHNLRQVAQQHPLKAIQAIAEWVVALVDTAPPALHVEPRRASVAGAVEIPQL